MGSDGIAVDDGPILPIPHDHIGGLQIYRLAGSDIIAGRTCHSFSRLPERCPNMNTMPVSIVPTKYTIFTHITSYSSSHDLMGHISTFGSPASGSIGATMRSAKV
jgi:hypothetical protein